MKNDPQTTASDWDTRFRTDREKLEDSGLENYCGKTLGQMTDEECKECLHYIFKITGTIYV